LFAAFTFWIVHISVRFSNQVYPVYSADELTTDNSNREKDVTESPLTRLLEQRKAKPEPVIEEPVTAPDEELAPWNFEDLDMWTQRIDECGKSGTVDELKLIFGDSFKLAKKAGDEDAMGRLKYAYDKALELIQSWAP